MSKGYGLFSVKNAWVHKKKLQDLGLITDVSNLLTCRLTCNDCGRMSGWCPHSVFVGNEKYVHKMRNTIMWWWWGNDFIQGFIALTQHDAHMFEPEYKNDHRILMVHCNNRNGDYVLQEFRDATHLVSVAWASSHFVVLYFNIANSTVTVFDRLSMCITNWEQDIVLILKNYGFVQKNCRHRKSTSDVFDDKQKRVMKMMLSFEGDGEHTRWTVTNDCSYKQSDGVSCGPIACLKVMEIYGIVQPGRIEFVSNFHNGYRTTVMDYFMDCVKKYDDVIQAELRMPERILEARAGYS